MTNKIIKTTFTILICFVFTIYVLPVQTLAFGPSDSTIYEGIDVSNYQGEINFEKVSKLLVIFRNIFYSQ